MAHGVISSLVPALHLTGTFQDWSEGEERLKQSRRNFYDEPLRVNLWPAMWFLQEISNGPRTGGGIVLIAVLTKNRFLMKAIATRSVQSGDLAARHFETTVDLIRHMLHREAIDLVVVDADTHLDAIGRLSTWKESQGRKDFAILVIGQLLRPEFIARALELGGDDFVTGTFDIDEFAVRAARCHSRLNTSAAQAFRVELANYVLDKHLQRVTLDGTTLLLSPQEFELAWLFFSHPGVLISRLRIAAVIWQSNAMQNDSALGKQIHRLRGKLRIGKDGPVVLRAVYLSGYRLEVVDNGWTARDVQVSTIADCLPTCKYHC
jgi:DNA-binding response OmpR family regulator